MGRKARRRPVRPARSIGNRDQNTALAWQVDLTDADLFCHTFSGKSVRVHIVLISSPGRAALPNQATVARPLSEGVQNCLTLTYLAVDEAFFLLWNNRQRTWIVARILIIDDEDQPRRMLQQVLIRDGYEVVEARDGNQGLQLFRYPRPI